jgi:hypothetical protein
MATPSTSTPKIGADLNTISLAADLAAGRPADARLGDQVWGTNGRRYVYSQANGAIPASTAVCTVNATTFLATSYGVNYLSPAFAMATGDRAWFSAASV